MYTSKTKYRPALLAIAAISLSLYTTINRCVANEDQGISHILNFEYDF